MIQFLIFIWVVVATILIDKLTYFNFYESFTMVLLTLIMSLLTKVWEK